VDLRDDRLPRIVHWGADLGDLTDAELLAVADAAGPGPIPNSLDDPRPVSLVPEHSAGWFGLPGLTGHRHGRDWSTRFAVSSVQRDDTALDVAAYDKTAGLALRIELGLTASGLLRTRATVRNESAELFTVDGLNLALPVPPEATELLDLAGRWGRERAPQRTAFGIGARVRENRRGRTGADASILFAAGTAGFGFRSGEVWALHLGWSGNHRLYAERLPTGESVIGAGELLLGGEVELAEGEEYETPWLYGGYGNGIDAVSARFHEYLRARPSHPAKPRPVVLNTWEAVYFEHDLDRLKELADAGAEVGVERFVLDDGWFRHRRSDHAGLGDWYVDEQVWPDGLGPLIEHVTGLGMDFGLWVEPEMVNQDSDLARAHPDWILGTGGRIPPASRRQQVLDLTSPAAYDYILERLDALLTEYPIAFLKWDHNRDLIEAGSGPAGTPAVHRQTLAAYELMAELRRRHPGLEIESCSSGGARVDLGVLRYTDRVWASDCIDALERQQIQRWTAALLPPELIGSHVGAPWSHTTGRWRDLSFRAGTALFGHFGVEWDISRATAEERAGLASWIALYKELRPLLHTGAVVRADEPDPALWVHGVVSADRDRAVFAVVAMTTALTSPPGRVRLPGLEPGRRYRVAVHGRDDDVVLTGRALAAAGLRVVAQHPEHLLLLRITSTDEGPI
jgi:alpha-galactosidase